jgi:hypothetical protein
MSASRVEGVETIVDSTVDYLIDTFTQPVGWVERSETHHVGGSILERRWVSLRSTHPTLATDWRRNEEN